MSRDHYRGYDIRFEIRGVPPDINAVRSSYDAIYSEQGIRQLDSFYRWILRLLQPRAGTKLLDVACGEEGLSTFARQLHGVDGYGSDISRSALQRNGASGQRSVVASSEHLPYAPAAFDYVTCIGSLEHFEDMRQAAREMRRVLRSAGRACILVPNTYSILGNVYQALKTGMSTIDQQPLQRYAARNEWALLLEESGFEILRVHKYEREPPDSWADGWWYLNHPRSLVHLLLSPLIPTNWAHSVIFICQPAATR